MISLITNFFTYVETVLTPCIRIRHFLTLPPLFNFILFIVPIRSFLVLTLFMVISVPVTG